MKYNIFLADDDQDDVFIFKSALKDINRDFDFKSFEDGSSLMSYLKKNELPDVLFLDINMPNKNGYDCLKEIRRDQKLQRLCVMMYSTSMHQRDIDHSLKLKADAYVQKPSNFSTLKKVLLKILDMDAINIRENLKEEEFVIQVS